MKKREGTYRADRAATNEPTIPTRDAPPPSPYLATSATEIDASEVEGLTPDEKELLQLAITDPQVLASLREPPSMDAYARQFWDKYAPILHRAGLLTVADEGVLEALAATYAKAKLADDAIRQHGMFIHGPDGPRANPAYAVADKSWRLFRQLAGEFGMSPSSRSRISMPSAEAEDEEDLLHGTVQPLRSVK